MIKRTLAVGALINQAFATFARFGPPKDSEAALFFMLTAICLLLLGILLCMPDKTEKENHPNATRTT